MWSRRSHFGCGDAIWPTGDRVQPPRRGGVVVKSVWALKVYGEKGLKEKKMNMLEIKCQRTVLELNALG